MLRSLDNGGRHLHRNDSPAFYALLDVEFPKATWENPSTDGYDNLFAYGDYETSSWEVTYAHITGEDIGR